MAILKLQLDKPIEAALKFAKGKFFESKFPGQEGQLMYSLTSGECVFLPESSDELFAAKGIDANEPIVLCLRKTRAGAKFLEVHKISDAQEPELDPRRYPDNSGAFANALLANFGHVAPSRLESTLAASITHVEQQRKALASKLTPPAAAATATQTSAPQPNNPIALVSNRPRAGSLMASAMVAAVDAAIICQEYASTKGLALAFGPEDIRAIAATLYIQHAKDPQFAQRQGGRQ